jgi:Domain of unknown function (DUF4345)
VKRTLQVVLAILSLLPLTFGALGVVLGAGRFLPSGMVNANLDSQFRFLSAWYLGLAVLAWWMLPQIEKHSVLFRIVCGAVFLGGVARLFAVMASGMPDTRFVIVMVIELLFPLLIPWQAMVARLAAKS